MSGASDTRRRSDRKSGGQDGFTLIEVIIVVIIAGILATVALRSVVTISDTARVEETKQELNALAFAMVGNPELENNGVRSDFGYVGDVGAMPPDLDALNSNPGGYSTWNGPYLDNRFTQQTDDFKKDAWGAVYSYSGVDITSSGSGSDIVRTIGKSVDAFTVNSVSGVVLDLDGTPPGTDYIDSVAVRITIPDGSGAIVTKSAAVDIGGYFSFDSIPIGNHDLEVIYQPTDDTLKRFVSVVPASSVYGEYNLPVNVWAGGSGAGGAGTVVYEGFDEGKRTSNGNSVTIPIPAGTGGGDLLIAAVVTDGNKSSQLTPPGGEGWTEIDISQETGSVTLGVWWKLADDPESPGHTFTWGGGGQEAYGFIMRFTGHDPAGPINVSAVDGGSSDSPDCPSVTTTVDNAMIVRIGGFDDNDVTVDDAGVAGHTTITMDQSSGGSGTCSGGAAYVEQPTAGGSGTAEFTLTASEEWRTMTLAIAPAP